MRALREGWEGGGSGDGRSAMGLVSGMELFFFRASFRIYRTRRMVKSRPSLGRNTRLDPFRHLWILLCKQQVPRSSTTKWHLWCQARSRRRSKSRCQTCRQIIFSMASVRTPCSVSLSPGTRCVLVWTNTLRGPSSSSTGPTAAAGVCSRLEAAIGCFRAGPWPSWRGVVTTLGLGVRHGRQGHVWWCLYS